MALQSASTTIKLFSVARSPLVSNLAAGTSIAAKTADQKRNASGGKFSLNYKRGLFFKLYS